MCRGKRFKAQSPQQRSGTPLSAPLGHYHRGCLRWLFPMILNAKQPLKLLLGFISQIRLLCCRQHSPCAEHKRFYSCKKCQKILLANSIKPKNFEGFIKQIFLHFIPVVEDTVVTPQGYTAEPVHANHGFTACAIYGLSQDSLTDLQFIYPKQMTGVQ